MSIEIEGRMVGVKGNIREGKNGLGSRMMDGLCLLVPPRRENKVDGYEKPAIIPLRLKASATVDTQSFY